MRARGKLVTVGTVLSTLALTVFATSPAHADGIPAPVGVDDTLNSAIDPNQNQLMDFKSWILDQPRLADSGYIESVNDSSTLSTTLLWSGSDTDLQKSLIAEGQRRGITVKVEHRKLSRAQLHQAAAKVIAQGESGLSGFRWSAISEINADFDGIIVKGVTTNKTAAKSTLKTLDTAATATTAQRITDLTHVPVRVQAGVSGVNLAAHRWDDTSPFNAGGLMVDGNDICSTGFSVNISGTTYDTTARHCIDHNYHTLTGGRSYGDGVRNSSDGAARQMSARGSGLMFDGAWNNAAGYKKTVIGYGDVSIGDRICSSGANSGVHCGLRVERLGQTVSDGYTLGGANPNFSAIYVYGDAYACGGDSGGPVLTPRNTSDVLAIGMIQIGEVGNEITTSERYSGNACYRAGWLTSMRTIVSHLPNASLVLG